ncbi:MAG: diguanylate cyclase [Lachnospiraceae bacterium]|nr:diguanylate cyclase [Lachnospiraceae bacterium]
MKLRQRLYAVLLVVSLIPLFLCGLILLYQNKKNIEAVVTENLIVTCGYQIDSIETFCEQVRGDMSIIAKYNLVQESLISSMDGRIISDTERSHIESLLEERKNYYDYLESIAIVDVKFRVVAASESYTAGEISDLTEVNEKLLSGAFRIGNVYTREIDGKKRSAMLACQGVYADGKLIGFIVEEILAEYFDKYHTGNNLWEHGVIQITDEYGKHITVGGKGEKNTAFYELQERHDSKVVQQQKVKGFANSGAFSYSLGNNNYVTCYSKLDYTDWMIRVTLELDSYTNLRSLYLVLFFAILAVGAFLMIAVNYFITERMTTPIEEICEVLRRVQDEDDYFLRIPVRSADEMGELQCEINHLLGCVADSKRNEQQEQAQLTRKTEQDPMTGVYNKKAIVEMVLEKSERLSGSGSKLAVAFVDIDDFKDYNTLYGHMEGDHVIKFVANTLRGSIHGDVGRYGGDEFVFCMETQDREIVEQTVKMLMHKLNQGVINGVTGERMSIPCSIGVVFEEAGKTEGAQLIKDADEAMYVAKEKGKNAYHIEYR